MKHFLHTCPLIAITLLIYLTAAVFLGAGKALPASASSGAQSQVSSSAASSASGSAASQVQPPAVPKAKVSGQNMNVIKTGTASPVQNQQEALFSSADHEYFHDALFIGDSLTEDLRKYGGFDNASFFTHVGLSIYQLFEKPKTDMKTGATLEQMLQNGRYGKIYILLGINEMGTGTTDYFARHYSAALSEIRKLQPKAILYVQSILPVTAEKSAADAIFNNPRIRERNESLKALANNKNIFYFNLASAFQDGSGNLPGEYSGDDVHIKAKYYPLWTAYLMKNAVPYDEAVFP